MPAAGQKSVGDGRTKEDSNSGIQAMMVGLQVLQAIARERRPLPLRDVAAASGLTPSRVHRYLSSLLEAQFIEQDPASGHYSLGQAVIEMGLLALGQQHRIAVGIEALREVNEVTGMEAHLSAWSRFGPIVVRWRKGHLGEKFRVEEGRVLPLFQSATGRVLMAYRNYEEFQSLLAPEIVNWNSAHPEQKINKQGIRDLCSAVRTLGMSSSLSHGVGPESILHAEFPRPHRLKIEMHAAPIFERDGQVPLALTIFNEAPTNDPGTHDQLTAHLRAATTAASRRLGAKI